MRKDRRVMNCNKLFINGGWSQATTDTLTQARMQVVCSYMETSLSNHQKCDCIIHNSMYDLLNNIPLTAKFLEAPIYCF